MKKYISLSALILILSIVFTSCKKHKQGKVTYQTIEVNLDANKTYQYNFGIGKKDLSITKQSSSFVVSEIDRLNENNLFNYTPKLNTISDEVEVTLFEDEEHHGHGGHSNCQHQQDSNHQTCKHDNDDDRTIYIFKFTIHSTTLVIPTRQVEVESEK